MCHGNTWFNVFLVQIEKVLMGGNNTLLQTEVTSVLTVNNVQNGNNGTKI